MPCPSELKAVVCAWFYAAVAAAFAGVGGH